VLDLLVTNNRYGEKMSQAKKYIMENAEESLRLDIKTVDDVTLQQARWAGLVPGMRVADIGCGPGRTTHTLAQLAQPGGSAVGVDVSEQRLAFATERYGNEHTSFVSADMYQSLTQLGEFDFIWVRFALEYHRAQAFDIVKNFAEILKPGGTLCLIDLDHNCLNHYGNSDRMQRAIVEIMKIIEERDNFDPFIGRKLYSFVYDLGFKDINVNVGAHHQIYGELKESDGFNWTKKVEVAARNSGYGFEEYPGGFEEFLSEFRVFFADPRRFTYTPLICCSGRKP
jgi:ubiquinone/menaquinone biosynthesis C-methylase UbiE